MKAANHKMKITTAIFAGCLAALGNGPAAAAAGDLYLSIGAMSVSGPNQRDDINNKIKAQGLDANVSNYNDVRHGWNMNAFLQLAPLWGVELGYADLGEVGVQIDGVAADVDSFLNSVTDIHPVTASGTTLALVGRRAIAPNLTLQAKGGVFMWRSSYELRGANTTKKFSANGTGGIYGIQLTAEIAPQIEANLGLQVYTVEGGLNKAIGLGLTYRLPVLNANWMIWR